MEALHFRSVPRDFLGSARGPIFLFSDVGAILGLNVYCAQLGCPGQLLW